METHLFWGQKVIGQGQEVQNIAGMGHGAHVIAGFFYCIVTHAGCIAAGVGIAFSRFCLFVCLSVCLFVRALKGKWLELSTPNFVHVYSIPVARHAFTQRSKGQRTRSHGYENRYGRMVASDACCYCRVLLLPRRESACRYDCQCFLVCTAITTEQSVGPNVYCFYL